MRGALQLERLHTTFLRMNASGVLFVAALNGSALGLGAEFTWACDLRVTADGCARRSTGPYSRSPTAGCPPPATSCCSTDRQRRRPGRRRKSPSKAATWSPPAPRPWHT